MISAQVIRIDRENKTTYTFWLKPNQALDYTAGQFIEMYIPHDADERGTHRWFTLSSAPSEEYIAVTTRKAPSMSSFKQQLFKTKPGDILQISQAMGDFVLPMQTSIPLIFIIRGIGVTPVRSMAKLLLDQRDNKRDISIIHSVRDMDDLLFKDIYSQVSSNSIHQIEKSEEGIAIAATEALSRYSQKPTARIYISGPEEFCEQANASLLKLGIRSSSIITDYFHGYTA